MTNLSAHIRPFVRRLAPMMGLLLLVLVVAGSAHHHAAGPQHVCAVCTASHSPAVIADLTAPMAAPAGSPRLLITPGPDAPRSARPATASSRAPPQA
jgi:hypothetical protein